MRAQEPVEPCPISDSLAFSQLYERAHLIVFRFIYGLHGGPQQEVEDLTAETFTKAWKARHRFKGTEEMAIGWLLVIARRLVIDTFRRQNAKGYHLNVEEVFISAPGLSPEEQAARKEMFASLIVLLGNLPADKREILVLRYILGWRVKEIGAYLQLSENTISVAIKRTLAKLRANWSPHD